MSVSSIIRSEAPFQGL